MDNRKFAASIDSFTFREGVRVAEVEEHKILVYIVWVVL